VDPVTWTASAVLALVGIGIGAFFRFGPGKVLGAVADAILGSPVIKDRRGEVIDQGSPGLVHRVAQVEEAVVEFRHMVGLLTETQKHLANLDHRVSTLEEARVERLVTQVESAHMWRAVADKDVIEAEEAGE